MEELLRTREPMQDVSSLGSADRKGLSRSLDTRIKISRIADATNNDKTRPSQPILYHHLVSFHMRCGYRKITRPKRHYFEGSFAGTCPTLAPEILTWNQTCCIRLYINGNCYMITFLTRV